LRFRRSYQGSVGRKSEKVMTDRGFPYDYLRCEEPDAFGGRVCVAFFVENGLKVYDGSDGYHDDDIGRALARKL
jgi:hypothetical protein